MFKIFYLIFLSTTLLSQNSHSLLFDGVDDKVDIPNSSEIVGTDDFSIAFWFKTENLVNSSTYKKLISSDTGNEQWTFDIEYGGLENQTIGTLSFIVATGGGNSAVNYEIRSDDRIDDGNWHFAVGTRERSSGLVQLYIDGILYNSSTSGTGAFSSSTDIILGLNVVNSRQYDGNLDQLSIWTKKLDESEIHMLMLNSPQGNEQDLAGFWNFNEGNGNVLNDFSGNGNDGTISGAEWSTDVFNGFLSMEDFTNVGSFSGKDYYISNAGGNYVLGKVACEYLGGNLVTITSEEENNFVINALMEFGGGSNHLWLGLDDQDGDGEYNWVTGEPLDYTNYGAAPSPGEAIEMSTPNGEWNDTPINDNQDYRRYMLEMVNNDGPEYPNHSLSFDGVDDLVDLNQSLISSAQNTFFAWFKANDSEHYDFDSGRPIYTQGASSISYANYALGLHSSGIHIEVGHPNDNGVHQITEPVDFNTWYHIAVVFNSGQVLTYLNGILESNINIPFTTIEPNETGGFIGNRWGLENQNNGEYKWNGNIDEVSIWDTALSQEQIQEIMHAQLSGLEEGLVAYWNFDDGEGSVLTDLTSNANDGTIYGATWSDDGAPVMPASIASVEVGTVQGYPNSEISVPVHIDLMQESVSSIEISFSEFQDHMEFVDIELEGAMVGDAEWDVVFNSQDDLLLTLSYGANEISGNGVLFHLRFNIPEEIDTDFVPVMIEYVHLDELDGDIEILNGGVEINAIIWGDVSQSGDVSGYDASLILKYLVGTEELDENQLFVADVTQDATISALDASAIAQYVVQLIDVLPLADPASVSGGGEFYVNDTELIPGEMLEIPIELASGENLLSFEFSAEYDESVFTLEEVVWSDLIDHFSIEENLVPGSINIAGMGTTPDGEEGTFGTIRLYVNPDFSDQNTSVNMSYRINESVPVENFNVVITNSTLALDNSLTPKVFALHQNYPNPFNPTTQIQYDIAEDSFVRITIYDVMGRNIRTLMNVRHTAGYHSIHWDAKNDTGEGVAAGMYIYTIQAGEFRATKKMVLLK